MPEMLQHEGQLQQQQQQQQQTLIRFCTNADSSLSQWITYVAFTSTDFASLKLSQTSKPEQQH